MRVPGFTLLALLALVVTVHSSEAPRRSQLLSNPSIIEQVQSYGYHIEKHTVTTADGVSLTVLRIPPYGKPDTGEPSREVVFLQHGLVDSAATWLMSAPSDSLGYILADAGYDVWLGNSRGTTYSPVRNWQFNWDQMASQDLPAMIDFVTMKTGEPQVVYIGHSQGTMVGFAEFPRNPDLAAKIKLFIALAPVAFLGDTSSELLRLVAAIPALRSMVSLFKLNKFDLRGLPDFVCQAAPGLCEEPVCLLAGCDGLLDKARIRQVFKHYPDTTSWQNMLHYQQAIKSSKFQMYDYGRKKNKQEYGQASPPAYDPSKLTVPSILIYGGNDKLADPADVQRLKSLIPPSTNIVVERISEYGHADFVWGVDAKTRLYPKLLSAIATASRGENPESFLAEIRDDYNRSRVADERRNFVVLLTTGAVGICLAILVIAVIVKRRRRNATNQAFIEIMHPLASPPSPSVHPA